MDRSSQPRWREIESATSYIVTWAPSRWASVPLIALAVAWDGLVVVVLADAGVHGMHKATLFLLFHIALAAFVTIRALMALFNSTTVMLDINEFRIARGPIPQGGNVREPFTELEAFALEAPSAVEERAAHDVRVLTRSAKDLIAFSFDDEASANFVTQRLNHALDRIRAELRKRMQPTPYR